MKSSYEVRARKFAQMIYPFITGCTTVSDYRNAVDNFNVVFHRKVRVAWGQTRVVLITSDYVLKIDYGKKGNRWGTCEDERKAYCKAVHDGFAHLFAKTTPYMVNELVFYIMPRIDRIGAEYNGWDDVYEYVDGDDCEYLFDNFRDLHYENFGWKNQHPVVVDYACLER